MFHRSQMSGNNKIFTFGWTTSLKSLKIQHNYASSISYTYQNNPSLSLSKHSVWDAPPWPWQNGTAQPSLKVRPEPPNPPPSHLISSLPACDIRGVHYHSISPILILSPPHFFSCAGDKAAGTDWIPPSVYCHFHSVRHT